MMLRHTIQAASSHLRHLNSATQPMKLAPLLLPLVNAFAPPSNTFIKPQSRREFTTSNPLFAMPICIVVEAEIKEDRMDDFLDMIEKNAKGSRAEPGCIRFGEFLGFHVCCVTQMVFDVLMDWRVVRRVSSVK